VKVDVRSVRATITQLTLNEMEEVYGGPLPLVVIAAGEIVGAGFLGGFAAAAGA
jgi:lactobin A/cerein 7B family class IIb bacteriocin